MLAATFVALPFFVNSYSLSLLTLVSITLVGALGLNLLTGLTGLLSLKVSHNIRFANQPPPGFENTDTVMAVALVAKF